MGHVRATCFLVLAAGLVPESLAQSNGDVPQFMTSDDMYFYSDSDREYVLDVFANDKVDRTSASITSIGIEAANGAVVNLGQSIAYKPPSGYQGVDTFSYVVTNSSGVSVSASVSVMVGALESWRIMPLGDSIIEAETPYDSNRRELWHLLNGAGFDVDFVGGESGVKGGPPSNPDFDLDHEGYWGWRVDQFLENDLITSLIQSNPPDLIFVHFATNDLARGDGVASTIAELDQVVAAARAVVPDVIFVIAEIIPSDRLTPELHSEYNAAVVDYVAAATTSESLMISVDQATGFDVDLHTYDGSHPNVDGENRMANAWFQAIAPIINEAPMQVVELPDLHLPAGGGVLIDVNPYFEDPEGQAMDFSVFGLPSGVTFNPDTGIINGVPDIGGTSAVQISAVDAFGAAANAGFSITSSAKFDPEDPKPFGGIGSMSNGMSFLVVLLLLVAMRWRNTHSASACGLS